MMSHIATCSRCGRLVYYAKGSDALDGHRCPDGSAPWIEELRAENKSRLSSVGGPVGDEVYSESQMERASLDDSAPPEHPEEQELAAVDYRLAHCKLCAAPLPDRWDERSKLVCLGCGAIYPGRETA